MYSKLKRAFWPSFFIISGLSFALIISSVGGYIFWWAGLACLLLVIIIGLPRPFNLTLLSTVVVLYIAYLFLNIFLLSPAFTAKGMYFVCYFAAGFFVFSKLSQQQFEQIYKLTVMIFALLSIWAIFQYITGMGYLIPTWPRANTVFFTPNTFAAAINLVLLPLVCIYLYGGKGKIVFALSLLLFAALVVTQSRGGLLAFLAGVSALCIMGLFSDRYRIDKHLWLKLISGFVIVFTIFAVNQLYRNKHKNIGIWDDLNTITRAQNVLRSGTERLVIYNIAWQRIKEKPILGYGYNHFQYYQLSDQPLSRKGILTKFVHNDYLQTWMETGIVGLFLLLLVIGMFYKSIWKYIKISGEQNRIYISSLLTGMTAYFVHANVDFVMYPPVLMLMFGAYFGITNFLIAPVEKCKKSFNLEWVREKGLRPSVICTMLGISLILFLSQPAIAQLAFERALRDQHNLDIKSALKYFELARRFAPYEPVYYSTEADIWYYAALATKDPEPARRADALLAKGASVNPQEVGNLFLRALLHRDVPELLPEPVSMDTVLSWLEYVMKWNPHDNRVQVEYVNTLYKMGRIDEVKRLLGKYSKRYPKSVLIKNAKEFYETLLK